MSSSAPASRGVNQQHRAMPFQLFLEKMRQPSAAELVSGIKQFINTFVDDDDDDVDDDDVGRTGKEEREEEKNNETFKKSNRSGNKRDPSKDSDKIQRFLREYAEKFRRHSLWRNCSQEEVEASTEGLEKYVCTKLYSTIFDAYGEEDDAINDALQKRVEALRNLPLTPEMLDISRKQYLLLGGEEEEEQEQEEQEEQERKRVGEEIDNGETADGTPSMSTGIDNKNSRIDKNNNTFSSIPKSLRLASVELEKMNTYKAPRDKMNCVLNACRIISNAVMRFSGGADAFIPSLIYSLAHANVQNLWKNIKYIERFRLRDRLEQGEAAYFFINVESGARFLGTCGKEQLNIFSDEKDALFPDPVEGLLVSFPSKESDKKEEKGKEGVRNQAEHLTPEPKTPPFNGFVVSRGTTDDNAGTPPSSNVQNEIEILETMGASLSLSSCNDIEYPYINAVHEHLTIGDINTLLISYKNLANKYEALKRGIEMKLRDGTLRIDSHSSLEGDGGVTSMSAPPPPPSLL